METLVGDLAHLICQPLPSVFDAEIIVVQSKGMQRWLSMELRQKNRHLGQRQVSFPQCHHRQPLLVRHP